MPVPVELDAASVRRRRLRRVVAVPAGLIVIVGVLVAVASAVAGGGSPHAHAHRAVRRSPTVEVLGEQVTRSPASVASATTTTTSTTTTTTPVVVTPPAVSTTCADALAYLAAHQAPGFRDQCADGSAFGHLGVTCVNQPGMCPGARIVHIACPAPFVYMNEAHNSWVLLGDRTGIDSYGQGSDAERAACAAHR